MKWFSNLISYGIATTIIIIVSAITTNATGTSPASSQNTDEEPTAPTTSFNLC